MTGTRVRVVTPAQAAAVHLASVEPGAVRGNHRHPGTTEWLLLFGGAVTLAWREGGEDRRRRFDGGNPVLLEIPPDIPHAVRGESREPAFLLSWADGEPVTHPVAPLL